MKNKINNNKLLTIVAILTGLLTSTNLFPQQGDLLSKVRNNDIEGAKASLAAGANVNQEDDMMGYTALTLATSTEMMNVLLSAGADINHHDKRQGYTPLMWAFTFAPCFTRKLTSSLLLSSTAQNSGVYPP